MEMDGKVQEISVYMIRKPEVWCGLAERTEERNISVKLVADLGERGVTWDEDCTNF